VQLAILTLGDQLTLTRVEVCGLVCGTSQCICYFQAGDNISGKPPIWEFEETLSLILPRPELLMTGRSELGVFLSLEYCMSIITSDEIDGLTWQ
jgi:hypothetical protein